MLDYEDYDKTTLISLMLLDTSNMPEIMLLKCLLKYQVFNLCLCGLTCDEPAAGRALAVERVVCEGHRDKSLPSSLPPHQDPEELTTQWSKSQLMQPPTQAA